MPLTHSHRVTLAALCLLATGAALLAGNPSRAAPPTPAASAPRPALTVSTTEPRRETLARRLPANGNVAAWQEASIGSESNGLRLAEVLVNVGDPVRAGQLLARFAADTVQADLAQARASLQEAGAAAAEAQANAERARALDATGAMSQQQIRQYITAAQTAQARVAAAQAAVDMQRLRLKHTEVRAPDAGVISARQATVGAVAAPGAELFRMLRRGRLEWRAEVTAADLPRLHAGGKALVTSASGAQVEGRVRMLAPTVDLQTRNALVYVDLPAHPDIRAGMFARGEFLLGQQPALTVPLSAVVVRDGFSYVFEVDAQGRVHMRRVQTGQRVDDRLEITEGLAPEARIVRLGGAFLNDGDLVRVAEESTQNRAQPPSPQAPATTK
ncbi:MAG: efflux RND transporter periplasmic adaptor subunit [Proteobacteria bacterium]|nr:efflux RND transporter periplasmic adaptor subunit [Pseudomonadota bacterium]